MASCVIRLSNIGPLRKCGDREIVWSTSRQACLLCLGKVTQRYASIFMWKTCGGAKQSTRRCGPSLTENLQTERER